MLEMVLFTTGGTIDGADSDRGTVRSLSSAAAWLSTQQQVTFSHCEVFNKDSREISKADLDLLVEAVQCCTSAAILITHGTFTIAESGRALKAALSGTTKTILLVGAWKPFGIPSSDAPRQMEFALETLRRGCPGVHIAMDRRLFDPDVTDKRELLSGQFELVETG